METTKVPKKRRALYIGFTALFLIAVAITVFILVNRSDSGEDLISQFEKAVNEEDISTLERIIQGNDTMEITEKHIKDLIKISKDEPDYLKDIVFNLKAQLAIYEDDKEATNDELLNSGDYFLTKDDGFFSSYQIEARPYSLTVSADEKADMVITNDSLDNPYLKTEIDSSDTTIYNLAPGIYTVYAIKEYEYADIEAKEEIRLFGSSTFNESVSLELTGKEIEINSFVEGVSIFINDEELGEEASLIEEGISSGDRKTKLFGPFSTDGSITVHGELNLPWGTVKSESYNIDNDTETIDITPMLLSDTNTTKQLTDTINDYAQEHINSLVEQDIKILKTASESLIEDHAKRINYNKLNGSYWKGKALGTKIDFKNAKLKNESTQYTARVPVEFHYKEKEYYKGMTDHESLEELFEESLVTLIYEEESKRWLVSSVESDNFGVLGYMENKDIVITKFN